MPYPSISCGCPGDRQFQNVLLLSFAFMLIFTAFQTMGNIEKTVLDSIAIEDPSFTGNGYISLAIIYAVFALSNWLAPSVIAVFKAKGTMIVGGILYTLFIFSFLYPKTWLLYLMSGILGFGAALIWTAQGNYLTLSSSSETMSRNSGVFWAILQCSMFFGNSFVFWQFEGKTVIDGATRTLVFSVLSGVATAGVGCLFFLRIPELQVDLLNVAADLGGVEASRGATAAIRAFKKSLQLFTKRDMILLSLTFLYTGFELSFFSGVYSSAVGSTLGLGPEAKRLVGLCGILVGAGEVLGGASFGLLGSRTVRKGRDQIVLLGFLCHTLGFYLIFLNLPNNSPIGSTDEIGYLNPPSAWIAMLCAFLLGLGDSCYNTQLYSILGSLFPDESAPAFALFKFTQSAAAAISFFYSSTFSLTVQLIILQTFCVFGSWTFFLVEWEEVRRKRDLDFETRLEEELHRDRNNRDGHLGQDDSDDESMSNSSSQSGIADSGSGIINT